MSDETKARQDRSAGGGARTRSTYRFATLDYARIDDTLATSVLAQQDGLWLIDFRSNTLSVKGRLYDKLTEPVTDGNPSSLFARVHPDDAPYVSDAIERHLRHRHPYDVMLRLQRKDGGYDWVRSRGQASWDDNGEPVQMVGVMDDLSDAVALRQSLRDSEDRFVNFANAVPGSVWRYTVDPDGVETVEPIGTGGAELWEVSDDELANDPLGLASRIHPDDLVRFRESIELSARHLAPWSATWRIRTPGGRTKWLEGHGMPRISGNGAITWTTMAFDVTEREEALRALQDQREMLHQSQKLASLGRIAGGIAHDFNNLLAGILGNAEILLGGDVDEAEREQLAREIKRLSQRGKSLSQQLLAFGRRAHLQPAAHDVGRVLDEFRTMAARVLPGNIRIVCQALARSLQVFVDRNHLDNALLNLAINARDAMPDGGTLTFAAGAVTLDRSDALDSAEPISPDTYVAISVADTGAGMGAEQLDRAIEPFYTTKEVGKGSGLGLSMVQGYARQSGGALHIDSEPGCGTTVTLFLPTHAGEQAASPATADESVHAADVEPHDILVAEDNRSVRDVLRRQLERFGHRVVDVADARAALAHIERGARPDLLITDLMMPGELSGTDLVRAARARCPSLRVLVMSGYHRGRTDAVDHLPDDVIWVQKPVTMAELKAAIATALDAN